MSNHFLGLRTVGYFVSDLEKAKEWYTKVLGTRPYFDQPFYVGFNVGGYELGLQPEEGEVVKGNNMYVYWGVSDAAASYQRLLDLGASSHSEPQDVGEGIIVATVKDPWDNIFGVICNPHFKAE
jgi:predicted enzyme related to lactoylglutathione lyase